METGKWQVIDRHTGKVMGVYATLKRASRRVDALDNAYGGYRYTHRFIAA